MLTEHKVLYSKVLGEPVLDCIELTDMVFCLFGSSWNKEHACMWLQHRFMTKPIHQLQSNIAVHSKHVLHALTKATWHRLTQTMNAMQTCRWSVS